MNRVFALLLALAPLAAPAAVCRILSGSGLAFGAYDLLATAPRDSQATLTVACEGTGAAQNVVLSMRIDQGVNGASVAARRMVHTGGAGDALHYGLFRDAARSSVWGMSDGIDTLGATLAVPATGTTAASFTIFGRIPPRQQARVGSYADAVQVTINY